MNESINSVMIGVMINSSVLGHSFFGRIFIIAPKYLQMFIRFPETALMEAATAGVAVKYN